MNILFIAAECSPFVKVGGLGDVIGALPVALQRLGHSVRVVIPHHGPIKDAVHGIRPLDGFQMTWNGAATRIEVAGAALDGTPHTYFIRGWPFFTPVDRFIYHSNEGIDVGRFLFFSAAALALARRMAEEDGWVPDIVHAHDWHAALTPYLLARLYADDPLLSSAASVCTIHNLQYQGWGVSWHLARAGLPPVDHPLLLAARLADNCLAVGIAYCSMLSTVSPRYAQEIATLEGGFGLDSLLHARLSSLVGILNGLDTARWDPATSLHIAQRFDATSLDRRAQNKRALQAELGLPQRADVPLAAAVTRLVDQKGPAILFPALHHMLSNAEMQFVLLGTGHHHFEQEAWWLGQANPQKAAIKLAFDEPLSERIYAASDMLLMPSEFEPCGIGQMIAMRYGSLPVVREVGGLADTVSPDVGYLFSEYSPGALQSALGRALDNFYNDPVGWQKRQVRAMARDLSWEASAPRYVRLYEQARARQRQYA